MAGVDFGQYDASELAARWRSSTPFPFLVLDDAVDGTTLDAIRDAVAHEPHWPEQSEIVEAMASAPGMVHPTLQAYAATLGAPDNLKALQRITGIELRSAEARSYVYLTGGYLLPHADYRRGIGRKIAWVHYLSHEGTCTGGELELFRCTLDETGEIVATASACLIEHRANRLVLFEVSGASLHQVREVESGARVSLAGWFH